MSDEIVAVTVNDEQQAFLEGRFRHLSETGWFLPDDEILYAVWSALPAVAETEQP